MYPPQANFLWWVGIFVSLCPSVCLSRLRKVKQARIIYLIMITCIFQNFDFLCRYEPFLRRDFPCPECKLDVNPVYRDLL